MTYLVRRSNFDKHPLKLRLARNLTRSVKRGHPWVFADALRSLPAAPAGAQAVLLDNKKGREIARGFYDPNSPLAFRVCRVEQGQALDEIWAKAQMRRALELRRSFFDEQTTGFRLFNGEGDGLPGLVCDVYGDAAVIRLDGEGASGFWDAQGIAEWVADALSLRCVLQRRERRRQGKKGSAASERVLVGVAPREPVSFVENGVHFRVDISRGQKTGFFLDQRGNRQRIRNFAAGKRVLNVFGYTGGFSVYAGLGGAEHVTTVDLAKPAIEMANFHWQLNKLPPAGHKAVTADAFEFLAASLGRKRTWELVILDPPSFAPSKDTVVKGLSAYKNLAAAGVKVTAPDGILALASCSSHINLEMFLNACEEGISMGRRRGTVLGIYGQPADHPSPLLLPEFRYLKFVLLRIT